MLLIFWWKLWGEKYLGLPTALGRSTSEAFEHIPTKLKNLVAGYGSKLMSTAARETLVKAVGQAIPTFSMSCFMLSAKTCKKITSILANFWWGDTEKNTKMHWARDRKSVV